MSREKQSPIHLEQYIGEVHNVSETGNPTKEDLLHLQEELERTEISLLYKQYEAGLCPNLLHIQNGCEHVVETLQEEFSYSKTEQEKESLLGKIKYFEARRRQFSYAAGVYADTIAQMWRVQKSSAFMQEEDYRDRLESIDAKRRRQHDGIIESLKTYGEAILELVKDGVIDDADIDTWNGWGSTIARATDTGRVGTIVVFSPDVLSHERRSEIQQWAIVADLSENLHLIELQSETLNKK